MKRDGLMTSKETGGCLERDELLPGNEMVVSINRMIATWKGNGC